MTNFFQNLVASTEQEKQYLLDSPIIKDCMEQKVTLQQYTSFLTEAYHHVKHTVPLFMTCGGRLSASYEWLRSAVVEYIEEEFGHQEWILNDLATCGIDKQTVRNSKPHMTTDMMVSYAYDIVQRKNPVGLFGMVFVLEGTSTALALKAADSIRNALQLPGSAFSYLISHGNLDQQHIQFYQKLVNRLNSDKDKQAIIDCAKTIYILYANIFRAIPR